MKSLKHLNKYFFKYRYRLGLGVLFVIISTFFAIVPAQAVREAVDLVITNIKTYQELSSEQLQQEFYSEFTFSLAKFGVIIVSMALLRGLFMFFMRQTIIVMSRLVEFDLKNEIFRQYQNLNLFFYRANNTGDLMARISEDVGRVRMYIGPAIMYTINTVVLFILIIRAMLNVNVELTLYVLLPVPFLALSVYYVSSIINHKSEKVQERLSGLSTFVQEAFSGIRVLKAFVRERDSLELFSKASEKYKTESLDLVKTNAFLSPLMLFLIGLSTIITVYYGGKQAIAGTISIGNIAEFIIYVNLLTWPVASIGWVTSLVQRAAASQKRINEFLLIQPEIKSPTDEDCHLKGEIEFKNVSFYYADSGIKALANISFHIKPGSSLAIMGNTGSGKTTISNLLLRLYDVSEGEILLDGINIKTINLKEYRNQIGYVPQDVFLFSDTISNNISFGIKNASKVSKDLVEKASKDAVIYNNIVKFPQGFETLVGERGITLSGGQKQRISIARALIKDPVILILDDCLSAVDTDTEEQILKNLKEIKKNRSSLIISHRVSSVKDADNILVLEDGQIIEQGKHLALLERKGLYYSIYQRQMLEKQLHLNEN